jgi:cytochrome b involved in lipid metabolism
MSGQYSLKQVSEHKDDAQGYWVVVDNDVYDVSNFIAEHPGGPKILKRACGKDSSKQFWKVWPLLLR